MVKYFAALVITAAALLGASCRQDTSCLAIDIECNPFLGLAWSYIPPPVIGDPAPVYANATNINDYISNDGTGPTTATGTACNTGGNGYNACLHGAFLRTAAIARAVSCTGLTIADDRNVLEWVCDDSAGVVRAVSLGLKPGVGLADLIDFNTLSFHPLQITLSQNGTAVSTSDSSVFWMNPIVVDNDGIGFGQASSGTINVVTQSTNALYALDVERAALVMQPGFTMSGTVAGSETIIQAAAANHLWVEVSVDLTGDTTGILFSATNFSVLRNSSVKNCTAGLNVTQFTNSARSNYISGLRIAEPGNCSSVQLDSGATYNTFERIVVGNGNTLLARLQSPAPFNSFIDFTGFAAGGNPVTNIGGNDLVLVNATLAASGSRGYVATAPTHLVLQNVATTNHAFHGVESSSPGNNTVVNLASANNTQLGINLNTSSNNQFRGVLKTGNNLGGPCGVAGGTAPGLISLTCTDSGADGSSSYTGQNSDAVFTSTLDFSSGVFIGRVTSDDAANTQDGNGLLLWDSLTDFLTFDNRYRAWAQETTGITDTNLRTACSSGSNCRIYDWSLSSSDTQLRNVNAIVTNNGTTTHTFSDGSTATFLTFAAEILGDSTGNENGLCESNERCLYSPNIGSYQGHGDVSEVGTVAADSVTNVTLYQYATNGR